MRKKERFVLGKRTFRSQKSKHFVLRIIYETSYSELEFDDVGVSDKVLCLGVELKDE